MLGSEHKSPRSPFSWAQGWKVSELCKYLGCFSLLVIKYWTSACAVSCIALTVGAVIVMNRGPGAGLQAFKKALWIENIRID